MARPYYQHRQAYAPAWWPVLVLLVAYSLVMGTISYFLHWNPPFYVTLGMSMFVGWVIVTVRWRRWKKRHPIITPEEWLQRNRDAAPWN